MTLDGVKRMGVFEPYRAIGYITVGVPFSVQRLGTETFVTVSVGKAFQIYNVKRMKRKFIFWGLLALLIVSFLPNLSS